MRAPRASCLRFPTHLFYFCSVAVHIVRNASSILKGEKREQRKKTISSGVHALNHRASKRLVPFAETLNLRFTASLLFCHPPNLQSINDRFLCVDLQKQIFKSCVIFLRQLFFFSSERRAPIKLFAVYIPIAEAKQAVGTLSQPHTLFLHRLFLSFLYNRL